MILLFIGLGMLILVLTYLVTLSAYLGHLDDELFSLELQVGMGTPDRRWFRKMDRVQKGYIRLRRFPGMGIVLALKGE